MSLRKKKLKNQRPTYEVCLTDSIQNAASTLLANIRFSEVDDPIKTIVITSSVPNEGKTTVALSLAIAAGRTGSKVLIIEGDMRRRSLRAVIGVHPRNGMHALLTKKCELEDALTETQFENLYFIDSEAGIPNPDGLLNSRMFTDVLAQLRDMFDYVIIDSPPITAFPDASIAARKCDGVVLVARENYTDKREITYALQQLQAADANILGVSLNCQESANGSYGYYYGYYYEEKQVEADSAEAREAMARAAKGDTHVTVKPVGGTAAAEPVAEAVAETAAEPAAEAADEAPKPFTLTSGPTAQAPGSRK